ncbi:MAG TPA: tetratricopeptide repeat protein [Planctomycetota bacterium]|nr:tetratricopeptide repeat protein [Planctomycetota bacterium]
MSVRPIPTLFFVAALALTAWCEDAKHPITLPDGPSRAGWEAFVKNDFATAATSFKQALDANPDDLDILEGMRWTYVAMGRYKEAQGVNLRMLRAGKGDALGSVFAQRAIDALFFVESRAEVLGTFEKLAQDSSPVISAYLRDEMSLLLQYSGKYDEARKAIESNGYVGRWVFAAGPFGEKDKNNPIERRFAPERAITSLDFKDENGHKVKVVRDATNLDRDLDLDTMFQDTSGVYYAMTNLVADVERDVILIVVADPPNKIFLRGRLIASEPDDEPFRRLGGQLYHVRLAKGNNPLLVKLSVLKALIVRVAGEDYAPIPGVKVEGLSEKDLAAHEVSTARGFVMGEKVVGSTAALLVRRLRLEGETKEPKAPENAEQARARLRALAEEGVLTLPQAAWLELVLQRENDSRSRERLARRMAETFGDSVGVLDLAAAALSAAGATQGNNESREIEEARRMREHALKLVPGSQQHLIMLADFFRNRDLNEQAFDLVKKCADAHPDSSFAMAELGREYERKHFLVDAERCYEKAAQLDNAQLRTLANFQDLYGIRARGRELREQMRKLGMLSVDEQYTEALAREDYAEAERMIEAQKRWQPERADDIDERHVHMLIAKGDLQGAYALRQKMYETQTARTGKRASPAALVDLAIRLGKMDEAKEMLTAYLAKHPNDYESRRRLSDLSGSDEKHWWAEYDVNVSDIDTSSFTNKKYPSANHAWIVDFMVTKILPDLSRESYVHIAQKVLNLQGINELSEVLVNAQSKDLIFIRTLNPDGSAYMPQNVHNFNLSQTASLYKVGPGSILEHAYLEHLDSDENDPAFNMGFNFNAIDAPRAVSRWIVMIPDSVKDKLDITRIRPEMVDEKILPGPAGYTVYQWTNKRIEGIKAERLMPSEFEREVIPLVTIETRDTPMHANTFMIRRRRDIIPDDAIAKAKELAEAAKAAPASKNRPEYAAFDAIVFWVRDNIEQGNESRTFDDVWFSKRGSSQQMTVLAREMAKAAGLSVHSALVNGSYLPGRVWHSKTAKRLWEPSQLAGFGSGGQLLVLEPQWGTERWAQFPSGQRPKFYSPFEVNSIQPGALALIADDGGVRVKRMLGDRLGETQFKQNSKVVLEASGAATTSNTLELFGMGAGRFREALNDPRQKERLREQFAHIWPNHTITNFQILGEMDTERPLEFNIAGHIDKLAEQANGAFYLNPFIEKPRAVGLLGQTQRENDLVLQSDTMASELDNALIYEAPEGFAWTEVPDDIFITTEFGFYAADFNVEGRELRCTRNCLIPAQRVTPEKYGEFLDFIKQIGEHAAQRVAYAKYDAKEFGNRIRPIFSQGYASAGEEGKKEKSEKDTEAENTKDAPKK